MLGVELQQDVSDGALERHMFGAEAELPLRGGAPSSICMTWALILSITFFKIIIKRAVC